MLRNAGALDRDRAGALRIPAIERQPQELALQHDRRVAEHDRQDQRVPGRLVLHRDDAAAGRDVLAPLHRAVEPDDRSQEPQHALRPEPPEAHDDRARRQQQRQGRDAEGERPAEEHDVEGDRAQPDHRSPAAGFGSSG
jgi:hypothetical protein